MGKVIPFRRVKKDTPAQQENRSAQPGFDRINAILNDESLTASHRHWILESMLMQIDEQLEQHRKELEMAERKLHDLVTAAEQNIASAYRELDGKKARRFLPWREADGRERAS